MQVFGADHGSVMAFEDRGRLTGWERKRAKIGGKVTYTHLHYRCPATHKTEAVMHREGEVTLAQMGGVNSGDLC